MILLYLVQYIVAIRVMLATHLIPLLFLKVMFLVKLVEILIRIQLIFISKSVALMWMQLWVLLVLIHSHLTALMPPLQLVIFLTTMLQRHQLMALLLLAGMAPYH